MTIRSCFSYVTTLTENLHVVVKTMSLNFHRHLLLTRWSEIWALPKIQNVGKIFWSSKPFLSRGQENCEKAPKIVGFSHSIENKIFFIIPLWHCKKLENLWIGPLLITVTNRLTDRTVLLCKRLEKTLELTLSYGLEWQTNRQAS